MTHASLFSGIGGFDLAAEWAGWENMFHCEWNEFGQKVLKYYWPNAKSYGDITKTDFTIWRGRIDVLTGGFPCQPYSVAGKRLGKEDERHLWPEMLRAIREISPRWVVGENVRGIISWDGGLVFEEVQTDLEAEGYEVQAFVLPACGVDAPHERYRTWFIAFKNTDKDGWRSKLGKEKPYFGQFGNFSARDNERIRVDNEQTWIITDSNSWRLEGTVESRRNGEYVKREGITGITPNTSDTGLQRCEKFGSVGTVGKERNKQLAGLLPSTWEIFPTQPPICSGNDGISRKLDGITFPKWRNESIKAYGNAIVPQLALQIFKAINEYEKRE